MSTYRSTKEIAALIRDELKVKLPAWKFSVTMKTFSMGSSITVALMEGTEEVIEATHERSFAGIGGERYECSLAGSAPRYAQLNQYQLRDNNAQRLTNGYYLTPAAWEVMTKANNIVKQYHRDDSDIQSDYFSCNFYYDLHIGKWNKDYEVKA